MWLDLGLSMDDPPEDCVLASWIWSKEDRNVVQWGQNPLARTSHGDNAPTTTAGTTGQTQLGSCPRGPADAWVGARPFVLLGSTVCGGPAGLDCEGDGELSRPRGCAGTRVVYQRDRCEEEGAGLPGEGTQGRGHRSSRSAGCLGTWPCVLPVSSTKEVPCVLGRRAGGAGPECP